MVPWTLSQNEVNKYVKGIGFHWYLNFLAPPDILTLLHDRYPDKFILATEACEGSLQDKEDVVLGSWERGEAYALDIIEVIFTRS